MSDLNSNNINHSATVNPTMGDIQKVETAMQQQKLSERHSRAKIAFFFSLSLIGVIILTGWLTILCQLHTIICSGSWHVLLVFIFGFNTLVLGLLYFNMSSWSVKQFSAESEDNSLSDMIPWINAAKQIKDIFGKSDSK